MAKKLYIEDNESTPAVLYVEEGTQPVGYTETTDFICDLDKYFNLGQLNLDYIQTRNTLISAYTDFSALTNDQKDVIGKYKALNGTTTDANIVEHYAVVHFGLNPVNDDAATQLMKTLQGKKKYTDEIGVHISKSAPMLSIRSESPKISSTIIYYLADDTQIHNIIGATTDFDTMLRRRGILGTEYGDMIDGIMDYFESTGGYTNGGLKNYILDPNVVASFPGADVNEQTDNARIQMISEIKDVIINGNI